MGIAETCGAVIVTSDVLCFIMLVFAATQGYVMMP